MGLRFRKRLGYGPFRLNLSKSGASTSLTVGGATWNPKRRSVWVNLPGPFFWTQRVGKHRAPEEDQ